MQTGLLFPRSFLWLFLKVEHCGKNLTSNLILLINNARKLNQKRYNNDNLSQSGSNCNHTPPPSQTYTCFIVLEAWGR